MAGFSYSRILKEVLEVEIKQDCYMYGGSYLGKYVYLFMSPLNTMLVFKEELSEFYFQIKFSCEVEYPVKIVGNCNSILLLSSDWNLYTFINDSQEYSLTEYSSYKWEILQHTPFKKVLAVTEYQAGFACLGVNKENRKQLISFKIEELPSFEDYTFSDLNPNDSCEYYLKAVNKRFNITALIVSDKVSGKIYLCSDNGQCSAIYCSKFQLISAVPITSKDCLMLCFENGKLFFHFFSEICPRSSLFLNNKVLCIEKCFCNDMCLLWSNGVKLHHTEINFCEGGINKTDFEMSKNIIGITSFRKVENYIIAATVNNTFYEICADDGGRKEIFQTPSKILSQIHNESLKISNFQTQLQTLSEYLKFKEVIRNNQLSVKVSCEEDILITNKSEMTFRKEFWKVELREVSDKEYQRVNAVKLEADMVKGMIVRIKMPFKEYKKVKVYLVGQYETGILSFALNDKAGAGCRKRK